MATWETFRPQHDQTLVDQGLRFVDIHRPDGKPDVLQQIEHGALQIAAQYRVDRPPGARASSTASCTGITTSATPRRRPTT